MFNVQFTLLVIILIAYGLPFVFIKGKDRIPIVLGFGTVIFYVIAIVCVFFISQFKLESYPFFEKILLAYFISFSPVFIINFVLVVLHYLVVFFKKLVKVES